MTRTVLGENAKAEIRESIRQCRGSRAIAAEATRLAAHFQVSTDRIYAVTKDLRTTRKTRADKGNRKVDIKTDPTLKLIVGGILEYGESSSEAIVNARMRGAEVPIEFPTLNRYMREAGLTNVTRRSPIVPYRRFEAVAPGEVFQFDLSGVKERWYDHETRRIISVSTLEVSKNHANEKRNRTRVWRFALIDDFSRRCFIRYVGVHKPSSSHVVDFLLQAYAEMGVPLRLYTDNDKIIKFGRNARTTVILNKVLLDQGGYENVFHLPGNSRATGKVERLHRTVEQCEKFLGRYIAERGHLSLEEMNDSFAVRVMKTLNVDRVHSETGQTPMARWENTFSVVRSLDYEQLRSAFMADESPVKLRGDLSFRLKGQTFQLPTSDMYPFADWVGHTLRVVFPDDQPFFTLIGLDGMEYDVTKETAAPDAAGDFKSTRETEAERYRKEARAMAREHAKAIKSGEAEAPIRFFDEPVEEVAEDTGVIRFPKPEVPVEVERVEREAPGRVTTHNPAVHYWEAFGQYVDQFPSKAECKEFLNTIFESQDGWLLQSEIEQAIANRSAAGTQVRHLKAV